MAATWITIAASSLPEIIRLARPLFTRTPPQVDNGLQARLDIVGEQIAELQNAATQNADSINGLATDMQKTLQALQLGAERAERQVRHATRVAWVAATAAALSFALAAHALAT